MRTNPESPGFSRGEDVNAERQPKGQSDGGQFAPSTNPEAMVELADIGRIDLSGSNPTPEGVGTSPERSSETLTSRRRAQRNSD
jgi:hypothetical protein